MKKVTVLLFLFALLAVPLLAQMQEKPSHHPPKIIQIYREDVKPGKASAHEKIEAGWPAAFAKAKYPYYSLGMTAISGSSEAWFLIPFQSFEDWQKAEALVRSNATLGAEMERLGAADGEMISGYKGAVAMYEPELSYRPDFNVGEMKYIAVRTVRVKPGHADEFKEIRKMVNAAHEKNNLDEHFLIYEVMFGAPSTTYLIFQPYKQIADLDMGEKIHNDAYRATLGADFDKKSKEFALNGVAMGESNLFAINPKMSYVSDDTASADMSFWRPKPAMAKAKKPDASTMAKAKEQKPKQ